jgi:hypothetical protein
MQANQGDFGCSKLSMRYSVKAVFPGVFESSTMTVDFFRNRLDQMIDLRHR